jgi:hypothetical protein
MLKSLKARKKWKGELKLIFFIFGVTCLNQGLVINITFMNFKSGETVPLMQKVRAHFLYMNGKKSVLNRFKPASTPTYLLIFARLPLPPLPQRWPGKKICPYTSHYIWRTSDGFMMWSSPPPAILIIVKSWIPGGLGLSRSFLCIFTNSFNDSEKNKLYQNCISSSVYIFASIPSRRTNEAPWFTGQKTARRKPITGHVYYMRSDIGIQFCAPGLRCLPRFASYGGTEVGKGEEGILWSVVLLHWIWLEGKNHFVGWSVIRKQELPSQLGPQVEPQRL